MSFIRRGGRLPRLYRPGPFEDSLRALATKTRMGRHVGAWRAQAPGQRGAFAPDSSEPRRVDAKPMTTDDPLPVWGTREAGDVIVPSRRPSDGDSRLVRARSPDPPVLCDRRLRPAGALPGDPRLAERRGRETLAERDRRARHLATHGWPNGGVGRRRRTKQIRNESSRDQRAVKTNFAACHGRTDYPRPRILSMHAENAMMAPRHRNQSTLIYNVFRVYGMTPESRGFGG